MSRKQSKTFFFHIGQKIVAFFYTAVISFTGLPGQDIDCRVRFICQFIGEDRGAGRIRHRVLSDKNEHLHGLDGIEFLDLLLQILPPSSHIPLVFLFETVHPQCGREGEACILQPLLNGDTVALTDIS